MTPKWEDMALVGRIARPHGNRGQVIVNPETDFLQARFQPGRVVYLRGTEQPEPKAISDVRFQQGRPIIGLAGIDTIAEAEALANAELRVPSDALESLPEGVFYRHELVGCRVLTTHGEQVGMVSRVEGPLNGSRLVVEGERGEVLIPLAAAICIEVNPAERRIVVNPPEGLLELNR